MPKLKTCKSAAKRFKKTKNNKIKRRRAFKRHLLSGKTSKSKRQLKRTGTVDKTDLKRIAVLLPY